jgi:hypothetical protein
MKKPSQPSNPSNSETSERLLQVLAASPVATGILGDALNDDSTLDGNSWHVRIPYEGLRSEFCLSDLVHYPVVYIVCIIAFLDNDNLLPFASVIIQHTDITESRSSWLSFMLYVGGLTFSNQMPDKQLRIPNLVAAQRFAKAILNRYQLRTSDIKNALQRLSTGDISMLLGYYQRLMSERDAGDSDLKNKSEEHHRDSFYYALLKNPLLLEANAEFEITRVGK